VVITQGLSTAFSALQFPFGAIQQELWTDIISRAMCTRTKAPLLLWFPAMKGIALTPYRYHLNYQKLLYATRVDPLYAVIAINIILYMIFFNCLPFFIFSFSGSITTGHDILDHCGFFPSVELVALSVLLAGV
jgi:hypothetical protein